MPNFKYNLLRQSHSFRCVTIHINRVFLNEISRHILAAYVILDWLFLLLSFAILCIIRYIQYTCMKQWCKNLCIVYECVAPRPCRILKIRDSLRITATIKKDPHQTRAHTQADRVGYTKTQAKNVSMLYFSS